MRTRLIAAVSAAGLGCLATLTGCSSGGSLGTAGSADELREAFIAAGGSCDTPEDALAEVAPGPGDLKALTQTWELAEPPLAWVSCGHGAKFVLFPSSAGANSYAGGLGQLATAFGEDILTGDNWVVTGKDLKKIQESMGGILKAGNGS